MTFNPTTFVFELINFLALVYILQRLLYRPLHEIIDRRREAIARAQAEAEAACASAQKLQQQLQTQMTSLEEQRRAVLAEARRAAEEEREGVAARTEEDIQRRIEESRRALQVERQATMKALQGDVLRQAIGLSARLLEEAADTSVQSRLTQHLVDALDSLPSGEAEKASDSRTALLEAASSPAADDLTRVTASLRRLLGYPVQLRVDVDPSLIAGVRLRLDGRVWDATFKGQLDKGEGHDGDS